MNIERDKFLTEAMGEIYLEINNNGFYHWSTNFSTWEGFGKLWEWAKTQGWFYLHIMCYGDITESYYLDPTLINPDKFADTIYNYLKEQ